MTPNKPEVVGVSRAVLAFVALPGVVALLIPIALLWTGGRTTMIHPPGLLPLVIGLSALLDCVRLFYISGKGTLAPWAPPKNLVTQGLYRFSRNPMYVSVILIVTGEAVTFGSVTLGVYSAILLLAFHLRIVYGEKPWLAKTHGEKWEQYILQTRRWL